jgi:hypothetical protein
LIRPAPITCHSDPQGVTSDRFGYHLPGADGDKNNADVRGEASGEAIANLLAEKVAGLPGHFSPPAFRVTTVTSLLG